MELVKLTDVADGGDIWINPANVVSVVRESPYLEDDPVTRLWVISGSFSVVGPPEVVVRKLRRGVNLDKLGKRLVEARSRCDQYREAWAVNAEKVATEVVVTPDMVNEALDGIGESS